LSWWHLRSAVRVLRSGGVIAYPTEAVFGLGCDPMDPTAVARVLAIKGRARSKGLILIASRVEQIDPLLLPQAPAVRERVLASWPGAITWLLAARPEVPDWLTGGGSRIAVRVTAHPLCIALCQGFGGPIVSTSANRSGRPPVRTALGARRSLGREVDYVLVGATGGARRVSEIRDGVSGRSLRPG
jgi:L-threonylcarbamoyladenylate synthase